LRKGKIFFSEEKKQKTFMSLSRLSPAVHAQETKSFLVLFFKKELLSCSGLPHMTRLFRKILT